MAVVFENKRDAAPARSKFSRIANDERNRAIFYQVVVFGCIAWLVYYLFTNTAHNLEARGMKSGFDFLGITAGFDVAWSIIPYDSTRTYGYVYLVGIINTLLVASLSIGITTVLGFIIGILRLSKNWLISTLAGWYVEVIRNTPLLLQILFWYVAVFSQLPRPKQSAFLLGMDGFPVNNRGVYFPAPQPGDLFWLTMLAFVGAIIGAYFLIVWAKRRQALTGQIFPAYWASLGLILGVTGIVFLVSGMPLGFENPVLKGFNFVGGGSVPPAFCALFVALVIYHAAYIAENVRAGILSVHKGQTEAAFALGLKPGWTTRLVIIPQAMRAIMPPLISVWMNVVKNSSLAIAIGYPDLVALFMQTSLNQSGHAIEIVAMVMLFYSTVSLTISAALNWYNDRVQIQER